MEDLPYEELDGLIQQICTGRKLIYVVNKLDEEVPLLIKHPTADELLLSLHRAKIAKKEALEMGLPSMEDVNTIIRDRGLYTKEDEEEVSRLRSKIQGQEAILSKTTRVPARRERLKAIIEELQDSIYRIEYKKELQYDKTAERKSLESKYLFLAQLCVFNPFTGKRYWETEKEFEGERDVEFRRRVFLQYIIFSHGLKQEIIRYVARSNLWRIRYITSVKTGDQLFKTPICEYNVDQLMVSYWSHYYQSINEMMPEDRPDEGVIEDDKALDAYMKDLQADRSRDATASRAKKNKTYGQKSAWDHGETLVMRSNPLHADVNYSDTLAEKSGTGSNSSLDAAPTNKTKLTKASRKDVFKGKAR